MSVPTNVVVNAVFLAVYALLLGSAIFNVFKNGHGRQGGFIFLAIFCAVKLVSNALLIAAYKDNYSNKVLLEAGYILQGFGYAFLFSASLAFYIRATSDPLSSNPATGGIGSLLGMLRGGNNRSFSDSPREVALPQIMHLVNTLALILLIVGYIKSDDIFSISNSANAKIDTIARLGDILFLIITAILAALTIKILKSPLQAHNETRKMLITIIIALPFMLLRSAFVTYQAFIVDPFQQHLVLRAVLQYTPEAIIIIIYTIMGFMISRQPLSNDVELAAPSGSRK